MARLRVWIVMADSRVACTPTHTCLRMGALDLCAFITLPLTQTRGCEAGRLAKLFSIWCMRRGHDSAIAYWRPLSRAFRTNIPGIRAFFCARPFSPPLLLLLLLIRVYARARQATNILIWSKYCIQRIAENSTNV